MTIQTAAADALAIQNAPNLSGIIHSFSQIMTDVLWPEAHKLNAGTDWVNRHPISILFATQIAWLTCHASISHDGYYVAYGWCDQQKDSAEPVPFEPAPRESVA